MKKHSEKETEKNGDKIKFEYVKHWCFESLFSNDFIQNFQKKWKTKSKQRASFGCMQSVPMIE